MSVKDEGGPRAETDASLLAERSKADAELARRVVIAEEDADDVLKLARWRADRLLQAARAAADMKLPMNEQTEAAVKLLLEQREMEDRSVRAERDEADELLRRERVERRDKLNALLVLERHTTDLHLAMERRTSDRAVFSREDFLARASHDLGALMGAQKLHLALLFKEVSRATSGPELPPLVATVSKINAQMDRLVSDLVDLVALEAGRVSVELGVHSAAELVATAVEVFAPLARERGQSLQLTQLVDVSVTTDAGRAVQVLGNLLSNAIKFTPIGGEIRVGIETREQEVVFMVADSGPGVGADRASQLFDRFVGSTGPQGGLGLGLFIAARLVEAHGGRLWLDNPAAQGATFRFTLPRAPAGSRALANEL